MGYKTSNIESFKKSLELIPSIVKTRNEASKNTMYKCSTTGLIVNVFDTTTVNFQGDTTKGKDLMDKLIALL
ncbi:hypothetical protein L5F09_06565 [Aliarcobacter butzleri]|uniref:hypothetical protein n=1 Tax=Aliarcobacter butzleri TaxID=28197 RepID=UPI001EDA2141|nr:hypothetical protein [Aliarcobacter butzleri]MCG3665404.1 hypothetical protein [Aliarcobacter butzleri]